MNYETMLRATFRFESFENCRILRINSQDRTALCHVGGHLIYLTITQVVKCLQNSSVLS